MACCAPARAGSSLLPRRTVDLPGGIDLRREGAHNVIPYVQSLITPEALALYERAVVLVASLPDEDHLLGKPVRCHEVARAVGRILGLPVVDGVCGAVQHSWLTIQAHRDPDERTFILDVYAVGRLPPVQLVDTFGGCLHLAQRALRPSGRERTGLYLPQTLRSMGVHPDGGLVRALERRMRRADVVPRAS